MTPPLNATAPSEEGRRGELTGEREYSVCQHTAPFVELMPSGHFHYGELRCANCRAFLPENVERRKLNACMLAKLERLEGLSDWERGFLANVAPFRRFSRRQEMVLGRIYRQFFGAPAS